MTPDAVLSRYLDLVAGREVEPAALYRLLAIDADLLYRWVSTLGCATTPAAIQSALAALPRGSRAGFARAQVWSVVPLGGGVRLGLDQWRAVLVASCLAEVLVVGLDGVDADATRLRVLLAGSGVQIESDPLMAELATFRGVDPALLVDAHPVLRAFAVSEALEHHGRAQAAGLALELFAIEETAFADCMQRAEARAGALIDAAGVTLETAEGWFEPLWIQAQVAAFSMVMGRESDVPALERLGAQVARALFNHEPRVFLLNTQQSVLEGTGSDDLAVLRLAVATSPSRVASAVRSGEDTVIEESAESTVADRQILRRLGTDTAIVSVLRDVDTVLGALVFRSSEEDSSQSVALMAGFAAELGHWMGALRRNAMAVRKGLDAYRAQHEKRLREIVHEANNPLSIVHNYLHILELRLKDYPETHEPLRLIAAEVRRAGTIIRKATEFPAPQPVAADTALPRRAEIDVNAVARAVTELVGASAMRAGITVNVTGEEGALTIRSDRDRLMQVLTNLTRNAVEAMAAGGQLTIETRRGVYRAGKAGVEIIVRDDGPGLPAAVLDRIYDPKASSKGGEHAGLGLHISARVVDELGGAMDVRTAPGKGTEFSIFLPDSV